MPPFAIRLLLRALPFGRAARALACLAALMLGQACGAGEFAVVLSREDAVYADFTAALREALPEGGRHRLIDAGSVSGRVDRAVLARADLVIAVGAAAAEAMVARPGRPVLAVMVARQNIDMLRARYPQAALSAVVLDQPLARQMRLIRAALPDATRVGVLLGPQSALMRGEVAAATAAHGLGVDFEQIDDRAALLPALERLLANTDAILALPDPVVFNVDSARAILLTVYRYRRPLIGYSRAYVGAGSLAAVHSTAADIARHVGEWLSSQIGERIELPPVQAPRYFSVAVNNQVARTLALEVADEATLADQIGSGLRP